MIKTYRGLIASGAQDKINLKTIKGDIGYRIVKFDLMTPKPGTTDYEHVAKIYKLKQPDLGSGVFADENIDFTDGDLLGAGFTEGAAATNFIGNPLTVIFDKEIFNQDIYITQIDTKSALACNYYLELEQIKLNENQSTVATLQSLRQIAER